MPRKLLDTRKSVVGYIAKGNKTPNPRGQMRRKATTIGYNGFDEE